MITSVDIYPADTPPAPFDYNLDMLRDRNIDVLLQQGFHAVSERSEQSSATGRRV